MSKVAVFTKPNCSQCEETKAHLERIGVDFEVENLAERPDQLKRFKSLGHRSAPIVVTDSEVWSGYQPQKIDELNGGSGVSQETNDMWDEI